MLYIKSGLTTWSFKEPTDHNIVKIFDNGRILNVGTKITLTLARPLNVITNWPTFLRDVVGKEVEVTDYGVGSFNMVVSDESNLTSDMATIVGYLTTHDTRGVINVF